MTKAQHDYAVARVRATRCPYIVTHMGHVLVDTPENRRLAEKLGKVAACIAPADVFLTKAQVAKWSAQ